MPGVTDYAISAKCRAMSSVLADLAVRSLQDGDNGSAVLFSLAALPDAREGVARPVVPEAERTLDRALATLRERGLVVRYAGFSVGFSPDGRWAVSFGGSEQVLTDLARPETTRTRLPGDVVAFAFSPDGRRLVRCSADRVDIVGLTGEPERHIAVAGGGAVRACRFGPDGRSVVAVGSGGEVGWWNAETGAPDTSFTVLVGRDGLRISSDGRRLAAIGSDGTVRVYDAGSGREVASLAEPGAAPDHVDLSADGSRALTTGEGSGVARVWDVANAKVTLEPFVGGALIRTNTDRFTEAGGPAALIGLGREQDIGTVTAGLRTETRFGPSGEVLLRSSLGYRGAFGDVDPSARLSFAAATSAPFGVVTIPLDRHALVSEARLDWRVTARTTVGLAYTGAYGRHADDSQVKGRVEYRW